MKLYPDQQEALDSILKFVNTDVGPMSIGYSNMCVLGGYAGTGKSTTVQDLVQHLKDQRKKVVMTAPTNKAVKVLRAMAQSWGIWGVQAMTIYSLLGLVLKQKEDKQVISEDAESKLSLFDVVVVDEASMANKELMGYILAGVRMHPHVKIIFVGDPGQLPPVNEDDSPVFSSNITNQRYLKEIRRQAAGNPIIMNSMEVRKVIEKLDQGGDYTPPEFKEGTSESGEEGFIIAGREDTLEYLKVAFQPGWHPDSCRVLCWTNRAMDTVNHICHNLVFGRTELPYTVGETICVRSPIIDEDSRKVLVPIETEAEVLGIIKTRHMEYLFPCFSIHIKDEMGKEHHIYTVDPADEHGFKGILSKLANEAKLAPRGEKKKKWEEFWDLKNAMVDIKHTYALTVHRSQGSTFENVLILGHDILRNPNHREMARLMYVAITRPSSQAVFFV